MTGKDFELIARVIKFSVDDNQKARVVRAFAGTIKAEHPKFNSDKFLTACGVKGHE